MTEGNQFLNRGILFSLLKSTRGNICVRQSQGLLSLLLVKIAADQLDRRFPFAESGLEQQVRTK